MAAAFEFVEKLGVPFFSFHDHDMSPYEGKSREETANLHTLADEAMEHMERTGVQLLWGTARLFHHPRYMAGAATNPDPEVFARAAAQVVELPRRHPPTGGRQLCPVGRPRGLRDAAQHGSSAGRSTSSDASCRWWSNTSTRSDSAAPLLIEPKPQEPTKHQYDYDSATVFGFLQKYGLVDEIKVNIEVNHATLSGHDFAHEVAVAQSLGIFGSVDANRGDDRLGWDTDQFPNSVDSLVPAVYEIIRGGGFDTGGFMFDTKLRRMSIDRSDLFHGHVGGIDTLAKAFLVAHDMVQDGALETLRAERYAGWDGTEGRAILAGERTLDDLRSRVVTDNTDPAPVSGRAGGTRRPSSTATSNG